MESTAAVGSGSASLQRQLRPPQRRLWKRVAELGEQRQRNQDAACDAGRGGGGGGCGEAEDAGDVGHDDAGDGHRLPRCHRYKQPSFLRHLKPLYRTEPFTQPVSN